MPRLIRAACSVLCRRQAIVIGPTPPGTGVIDPATVGTGNVAVNPDRFNGFATRVNDVNYGESSSGAKDGAVIEGGGTGSGAGRGGCRRCGGGRR